MLTVHCRRAAGLSFLQINELAYYFPNCLLAQLTLWGTSSPEMNTVKMIFPSCLVQAYVILFLQHVFLFCFAWYLDSTPTRNVVHLPNLKITNLAQILPQSFYWG